MTVKKNRTGRKYNFCRLDVEKKHVPFRFISTVFQIQDGSQFLTLRETRRKYSLKSTRIEILRKSFIYYLYCILTFFHLKIIYTSEPWPDKQKQKCHHRKNLLAV